MQTLGLADAAQLDASERDAEAAGGPGPGTTAAGRRGEAKQVGSAWGWMGRPTLLMHPDLPHPCHCFSPVCKDLILPCSPAPPQPAACQVQLYVPPALRLDESEFTAFLQASSSRMM